MNRSGVDGEPVLPVEALPAVVAHEARVVLVLADVSLKKGVIAESLDTKMTLVLNSLAGDGGGQPHAPVHQLHVLLQLLPHVEHLAALHAQLLHVL